MMDQYLSAYERSRDVWTDFEVSHDTFKRHLIRVDYIPQRADNAPALYLCAGCALGIPAAVRALERTEFPAVRATIGRVARQRYLVDELVQEVRSRLLVGRSAKISTYHGAGPLGGWLRVVAGRVAIDHQRAQLLQRKRAAALKKDVQIEVDRGSGAERNLDERPSREVERLLAVVIASLEPMDKQLIRHYFGSQLSVDVLGAMYGVDRSTAARWVRRVVERIRDRVRKQVAERFAAPGQRGEVDEFLASCCEKVEIDLSALVGDSLGDVASL